MSQKEEIDRLHKILQMTGSRKGEFAKKLEVSHQALNFYLKGDNDFQVITRKLSELGFSIDWLYTGVGEPKFQKKIFIQEFEVIDDLDENKQKNNIINWIIMNYGSIVHFEIERGFNKNQLNDILFGDEVLTYDILVKLDNAGLNLKWSVDCRGNMFNDKNKGKSLQKLYDNDLKDKIIKL